MAKKEAKEAEKEKRKKERQAIIDKNTHKKEEEVKEEAQTETAKDENETNEQGDLENISNVFLIEDDDITQDIKAEQPEAMVVESEIDVDDALAAKVKPTTKKSKDDAPKTLRKDRTARNAALLGTQSDSSSSEGSNGSSEFEQDEPSDELKEVLEMLDSEDEKVIGLRKDVNSLGKNGDGVDDEDDFETLNRIEEEMEDALEKIDSKMLQKIGSFVFSSFHDFFSFFFLCVEF